jgi:hypothetical protein
MQDLERLAKIFEEAAMKVTDQSAAAPRVQWTKEMEPLPLMRVEDDGDERDEGPNSEGAQTPRVPTGPDKKLHFRGWAIQI